MVDDYFANIVEFISTSMAPYKMIIVQKKQLVVKAKDYQLIVGNLYKLGEYELLRHCVLEHERLIILEEAHNGIAEGYYTGKEMTQNILCVGLWWPTLHKDVKEYFQPCDVCHRVGKLLGEIK
jgi:hypothetical protein